MDGCIEWQGYRDRDGYGRNWPVMGEQLAHRIAYAKANGPIPEGLTIDHLCRNRACVNPEHLEAVTREENIRRRVVAQTHCKNGHEFTPDNTRIATDRKGRKSRACRACNRAASRRSALKKKEAA